MSAPTVRQITHSVVAASKIAEVDVNPKLRIAQDAATRPTENQLQAQREIRDALNVVAVLATEHIADKRYLSIVETKLEEALLFAGKAIFA